MTREEARLILDTHTLNVETSPVDPQVFEALDFMRGDPELERWYAARHASDKRIAEAVAAIEVPPHLHERLLALDDSTPSNVVKLPPWRSYLLFALAAVFVLAITAGLWFRFSQPEKIPKWEADSLAMVQGLDNGKNSLDHKTHDLNEIKGFLAKASAPEPAGMPPKLPAHPPVGCKSFRAAGLPSSVVCFEIAPGVLAHLVTVKAGPDASGALVGKPKFAQNGAWHTAVWSDGKQTYILGTRAEMKQLKELFG
jgi:hypothetical protein